MDASGLYAVVIPMLLVATRVGGLFVWAPVLAGRGAPVRFRALAAVGLALAAMPMAPPASLVPPDVGLLGLLPLLAGELLIGSIVGLIAAIPIMSMDLSGYIVSHQMGMGLARVYNPETEIDTDVIGQLLMYVAIGAFVAAGGLEAAYLSVVSTFRHVPLGAVALSDMPIDALVGAVGAGMELAIRVAAPVMCAVALVMVSMGFVMKTMPQINVMSVGFSFKILTGVTMLALSVGSMGEAIGDAVRVGLGMLLDWGASVGAP